MQGSKIDELKCNPELAAHFGCVCVFVCMHTYIYTHTYIHTFIHIHTHIHIHIHIYTVYPLIAAVTATITPIIQ